MEAKDQYTHGHTERVTNYSLAMARQMTSNGMNFPKKFIENLYIASLLHDIGKIGVPETILNKIGKLLTKEYDIMKRHPTRGVEIIQPLNLPKECVEGIKHHHERYDGKGYPEGLSGDSTPMLAAIISVADAYDAMISDRPYRKAIGKEAAIEEIKKFTGSQFHPVAAKAMLELWGKGMV
ncbi:MAG: HD-GYP domain-containing protein [Candidatus Zapsychrus exili]|nr:HD-GYP domain-containing protein [Candidatus Zapsychrus exili]